MADDPAPGLLADHTERFNQPLHFGRLDDRSCLSHERSVSPPADSVSEKVSSRERTGGCVGVSCITPWGRTSAASASDQSLLWGRPFGCIGGIRFLATEMADLRDPGGDFLGLETLVAGLVEPPRLEVVGQICLRPASRIVVGVVRCCRDAVIVGSYGPPRAGVSLPPV